MSYKDLLLQKYNWKWIRVGDVCEITRGFNFENKQYIEQKTPILKVSDLHEGEIKGDFSFEDHSIDLSKYLLKPGEVCIVEGSRYRRVTINKHKHSFYIGQHITKFRSIGQIIPIYLFFCLDSSDPVTRQVESIKIPLPPLDIQRKISHFLDLLKSDEKRVKRELENRKKQYEHYQSLIIGRVEKRKRLGEISEIFRGNNINKTDVSKSGFPCIVYSDVSLSNDLFLYKYNYFVDPDLIRNPRFCRKNDVLVSCTCMIRGSVYLGKPCLYLGDVVCVPGNSLFVVRHEQNPKYMAYVLSSRDVRKQNISNAARDLISVRIGLEEIKKITIPLPSMEVQKEIVRKLDKFKRLCMNVLPKELELVQKRYRYYRELFIEKG